MFLLSFHIGIASGEAGTTGILSRLKRWHEIQNYKQSKSIITVQNKNSCNIADFI